MKHYFDTFLFLSIINTILGNFITLQSTTYRPSKVSTYSLNIYNYQILELQKIQVKLPDSYNKTLIQCKCIKKQLTLVFFSKDISQNVLEWNSTNPDSQGEYVFQIIGFTQQKIILQQHKTIHLTNKLKISSGNINVTINTTSNTTGQIVNYTIRIVSSQNINESTWFGLSFPAWSPLRQSIVQNKNNTLCYVKENKFNCTWDVRGTILQFFNLFYSNLRNGFQVTIILVNFSNPSSTQPYGIVASINQSTYPLPITITNPKAASLLFSNMTSNQTGASSNTDIQFSGTLYINQSTIVKVQFQNIASISYNNNTYVSNFSISPLVSENTYSFFKIPYSFSLTNSYVESTMSIAMTTYVNSSSSYQIQKAIYTKTIKASQLTITYSPISLFTNQTITFNITLPFSINQTTILKLIFQNNQTKFNCTNCHEITLTIPANNKTISKDVYFQFGYFQSFSCDASRFFSSKLSSYSKIAIVSFCGSTCKICNPSNSVICTKCFSQQESSRKWYFYVTNSSCQTSCPSQTYTNNQLLQCIDCQYGCQSCTMNNCSQCLDGFNLRNGSCISVCGLGSFLNNSNQCQFCSDDCQICINKSQCISCSNETSLINGICRQNCSEGCRKCQGQKCVSCLVGYLYADECYSVCPLGTIHLGNRCQYATNIVTFPFLITLIVLCIGFAATKFFWKQTDVIGLMVMITGLCQVCCALATIRIILLDFEAFNKQIIILGVGLIAYLITNLGFLLLYILRFKRDETFINWSNNSLGNKISLYSFLTFSSIFSFKIFRGIYSQFLSLQVLTSKFNEIRPLIPFTNILSGINCITFFILSIVGASMCLLMSPSSYKSSQGYFFCIELITIIILSFILGVLDLKKPEDYFVEKNIIAVKSITHEGTLQNIETGDNDKSKTKLKKKSKSPEVKDIKSPSKKDKKQKNVQQQKKKNQIRKGNRFNRKKRLYDTGSNQSFDIYLDFDHQPKQTTKEKKRTNNNNRNYRSGQLKAPSKIKQHAQMNDIYIGFMNTQSDQPFNTSVQLPKETEHTQLIPQSSTKPQPKPIQIILVQQQPQTIINLNQPIVSKPVSQLKQETKQLQNLITITPSMIKIDNEFDTSNKKQQKQKQEKSKQSEPIVFSKTQGFNN